MKKRTPPALIVLPSLQNELTGLECSDCGQLFLVDFTEYDEWHLMDEFGRHLRERHKGCSSFPPYEIRLAQIPHGEGHVGNTPALAFLAVCVKLLTNAWTFTKELTR